ncbi:hypothetical protein OXX79_012191, partial [Metschnikowia pulcherrima]
MEDQERAISRLWRSFRTVKEMVRDKGYYITDEEINMSLDEFKAKVCSMGEPQRKLMCFQAQPTAESAEKFPEMGSLWVEFCDEAS